MKKISEMALEELQDYAIALEAEKKELGEQLAEKDKTITEAHELNRLLQKRNNDLFMKVEQQTAAPTPATEEPATQNETCEDFAKNLIKEGRI